MKIRMLTSAAGVDFMLNRGEVTDRFPVTEAMSLVSHGYAEIVEDVPTETAVVARLPETRKGKRAA